MQIATFQCQQLRLSGRHAGRRVVLGRCRTTVTASVDPLTSRRAVTASILFVPALLQVPAAHARDYLEAKKRADERREKLREASSDMRNKGKSEAVFDDSKYAVSEDKTPNIHSRQEEGIKSQSNI